MPNIFNYIDYRKYLKDFYCEKKSKNSLYSYSVLARSAGFKSKSHIAEIISGKKNISSSMMYKLAKALKLHNKPFAYFKLLVAFNQSKIPEDKQSLFEQLSSYSKRNIVKKLLLKQFDFYSAWYHNTIRELVCMEDFGNDFAKLAAAVSPPITARQAGQSVDLLLSLGLIQKCGRRYKQTDPVITSGGILHSVALRNFHLQNLQIAASSIDRVDSSERDISCVIAGLSDASASRIKDEISRMRERILQIAHDEKNPTRVYHMNFQVFPTSAKSQGKEDR